MIKYILMISFVLSLSACSFITPKVQEVDIPVVVPCKVETPRKPLFIVDSLPIGSDIFEQVKALLAERKQRQGYEKELEAVVEACK